MANGAGVPPQAADEPQRVRAVRPPGPGAPRSARRRAGPARAVEADLGPQVDAPVPRGDGDAAAVGAKLQVGDRGSPVGGCVGRSRTGARRAPVPESASPPRVAALPRALALERQRVVDGKVPLDEPGGEEPSVRRVRRAGRGERQLA